MTPPVPALAHRDVRAAHDQPVYWNRASADGAPYLGRPAAYRESEYRARVARVAKFQLGWFDLATETGRKDYCEVMSRVANGWYRLARREPLPGTCIVYLEWVEFYMRDVSKPG